MKISNVIIHIPDVDAAGYSPMINEVSFTDSSGTRYVVPLKLIVRLYEGCKYHEEKSGVDWDRKINALFE